MQRSYIKILFASALAAVALSAAVNLVIDPYGLYRWVDVDGFNRIKPKSGVHGEIVKPYRVLEVHPRTVLLGNSRVEVGLDPASPQWPPELRPVFNFALPASGIDTALLNLQHADAGATPTLAIVGLDFFDFVSRAASMAAVPPAGAREPSEFEKRLLVTFDGAPNELRNFQRFKDHATTLFSFNTFVDAVQTVLTQRIADQADLTDLGFNPMREYRRFVRVDGHSLLFRQMETTYLRNYFRISPAAIYDRPGDSHPLRLLRRLIAVARANDVRLVLYVHPYHAHMLENYRIAGMWDLFEEWKRAVVRIVEQDAAAHPDLPVALWDFSGYNEYTGERVPSPTEKGRTMQWYWEAGHYKRELGDLVLARILAKDGAAAAIPGVKLSARNIEEHLEEIRRSRRVYAVERHDEIAALEKLAEPFGTSGNDRTAPR